MTDFDREMDALLESAWQAASPAPGDLDRVEALVHERVARGPNDSSGGHSSGGHSSGGHSSGVRGARLGATSLRGWPRLLPQAATATERARLLGWGSLIAGVAFLLGVGFGHTRDVAVPDRAPAAVRQPVVAGSSSTHDAPVSSTQTPSVPPPAATSEPPPPGTRARVLEPPLPAAEQRSPRTGAGATRAHSSARLETSPRLGFDAVLALLERAERSLRRSEPAFALSLLDDIDARADAHTLYDERLITRVLAACALGDVDAARRARARLESTSGSASIYASRLSETCVATSPRPIDALERSLTPDGSDRR